MRQSLISVPNLFGSWIQSCTKLVGTHALLIIITFKIKMYVYIMTCRIQYPCSKHASSPSLPTKQCWYTHASHSFPVHYLWQHWFWGAGNRVFIQNVPTVSYKTAVYISPGRHLDLFKGRPIKAADIGVWEWIADVRAQLELRFLTHKEAAAFIKEHLSGDEGKEIIGRGDSEAEDSAKILEVLARVFGDGDKLPQLQQRFFAYTQSTSQDLLRCSGGSLL